MSNNKNIMKKLKINKKVVSKLDTLEQIKPLSSVLKLSYPEKS